MARETVLIVEDRRENIVHLANNVLKPQGYEVITAMDGQRGLQRILADKPDLVIMDLNMPKMDGLEVLAKLKERGIRTPVILTTFYGSKQVAQQALSLGAVDYVVKPYDVADMLASVQNALAERRQAPDEMPGTVEETMPLTRQVERWMRDMNILTRVGKALVALLELNRICARTVEAAIYLARADYGFLFLAGETNEADLCLCAFRGPTDPRARLIDQPVDSGLAVQVHRSGQMAHTSHGLGDPLLSELAGKPLGSAIAIPLRWQRRAVGVLVAARDVDELAFSEADLEWLNGLGEYAAIAVRNAQTFEQCAQPAPLPSLDKAQAEALRHGLEELGADLQEARDTLQHLTALLNVDAD